MAGGQAAEEKAQRRVGLVKDRQQAGGGWEGLGTAGRMDKQVGGVPRGETNLGAARQVQHLAHQFVAVKQARVDDRADRIQP